ncbi:MAG: hypothetical protein D6781_10450 [Verrucomicrobia bacterium]|nr:MAG: hypothetical protein D6781_10450 [Verrucomicrobiota bacterium]
MAAFRASRILCVLLPCFLAIARLAGASPLETGLEALRRGIEGDAAALREAVALLQAACREAPGEALPRAWLGAALVWRARDVPLLRKRAQAEAGFRELDAAVAMAPEDAEVRLIRAETCSVLPQMAGRHEIVAGDFAWLVARANAAEAALPDTIRRRIFYRAGAFALRERREAEAVRLLEQALATPGPEPEDALLQSMLALPAGRFTPLGHGHAEADEESAPAPGP